MRVRTLDYTVFTPKKYELTKTVNLQGLNFVSDKEFATITRSIFVHLQAKNSQTFLDDYYPGPGFCSVMLVTQQFECISENSLGNIHDCGA